MQCVCVQNPGFRHSIRPRGRAGAGDGESGQLLRWRHGSTSSLPAPDSCGSVRKAELAGGLELLLTGGGCQLPGKDVPSQSGADVFPQGAIMCVASDAGGQQGGGRP